MQHRADLQRDVHVARILRIDGDVADVRLDHRHRIGDLLHPVQLPYRVEAIPACAEILADEHVDGLPARVQRAGVSGVDGDRAHLAGTGLAIAGLLPARAEVFTDPHPVAARTGEYPVRCRRIDGDLRDRPVL